MTGLNPDQQAIVQALLRDVTATLGVANLPDLISSLTEQAQARHELHPTTTLNGFRQRLVDDFQQRMHDEFIDVSWPPCPRHRDHPLWLSDGVWRCSRDGVTVAALGELSSLKSDRG